MHNKTVHTDGTKKAGQRALQRLVKLFNIMLVAAPFAVSWCLYYLSRLEYSFNYKYTWLIIFLFAALYYSFTHLYSGYLLHLSRISELIYAQILAALISNLFVFVVIVLLFHGIPNLIPLLVSFLAEIVLIIAWCYLAHQWYFKKFRPKHTMVVWNDREGLESLIQAYGMDKHFNIVATPNAHDCLENDFEDIRDAEVVFLYGVSSHDRNQYLKYCVENEIVVYVIPRIGDVILSSAHSMHMFHLPMLMVERYNPTPEYLVIKRFTDIAVSLITLIILSPVFLVVGLAIRLTDGGPALYNQKRLTKDGKEFYVHKFRSMRIDAEKDGVARLSSGENDPRITPIGRVIRKYRIDEFPQLINILKGEMSIVGPRPERPEIAAQYEEEIPEFRLRLQAKAGLTGYAQVYGKYNTTPYDKLLMDLMYIAKPSIAEDFKIIFATIKILFLPESTEGVAEGQTTASVKKDAE